MEKIEIIMMDHPPHHSLYKKTSPSLHCKLFKVIFFCAIFVITFHLPHFPQTLQRFTDGFGTREETVHEIFTVLERYPTGLAKVTIEELAEVIYEESVRYNQDPKFILALIAIESSFQNWSVSERGAKGLMQIMPCVAESIAKEIGIEWSGDQTLFNPFINIRMGSYYLSRLILDFNNNVGIALTAYNYGPTYVKSLIERKERIPIQYYRRVLTVYKNL